MRVVDEPSAEIVAILYVTQTLTFEGGDPVEPGDYVVKSWRDADGIFIGATISGWTTPSAASLESREILDQQIPAIPPASVSEDETVDEVYSEISGFRVGSKKGCCIFQKKCP